MRIPRSSLTLGVAVVAGVLALTGCSASPIPTPSATATPISSPESSQKPLTPVPTSTPTTAPASFIPIGLSCSVLLPNEFVFDISPNFQRQDDYVPQPGSTDAYILSNEGVACRIVNLSGGDYIDLAIAGMDAVGMATLVSHLSSTQPEVDNFGTDGVRGFFTVDGGVGQASAVTDKYWVLVSSPLFSQAADAAPIIEQALSLLPS